MQDFLNSHVSIVRPVSAATFAAIRDIEDALEDAQLQLHSVPQYYTIAIADSHRDLVKGQIRDLENLSKKIASLLRDRAAVTLARKLDNRRENLLTLAYTIYNRWDARERQGESE